MMQPTILNSTILESTRPPAWSDRCAHAVLLCGWLAAFATPLSALAGTVTITGNASTDTTNLNAEIAAANASGTPVTITIAASGGNTTLNLTTNITRLTPTQAVTIVGTGGAAIDGGGNRQLFSVGSGTVSLKDLALRNGFVRGGAGGNSSAAAGGGGGGAGAALFVNSGATVSVENVAFTSNTSTGGNGGTTVANLNNGGAGGGGLNGGAGSNNAGTTGGNGGSGTGFTASGGSGGSGGGNGGAGATGGGGGGGNAAGTGGTGGNGGFGAGGGGGGGGSVTHGAGGTSAGGGGDGSSGSGLNGQAGTGYGGAVVVLSGGSLTIKGTSDLDFSGNTANKGAAGQTAKQNLGNDIYINGAGNAATFQVDSGSVALAGSSSTSAVGSIGGDGGMTKTGAGALVLSGTNTYTGATAVNAGSLMLNGSITSDVTVGGGAVFGGTGSILGGKSLAVASGGTVAPGNSIGTLTVSGGFTPAAGSIYLVEINPAGQSDKLVVTGTASLGGNGTVRVSPTTGSYTGLQFVILTAGTLTGQFAGVTSLDPTLSFMLTYGSGSVTLVPLSGSVGIVDGSQAVFTQNDSAARGSTITFRGGTLRFTADTTLTQPITIEATGGVLDSNGRIAGLTGAVTNAGTLTIRDSAGGGSVGIFGTLTGGALSVASGGTLRGTGTIGATTAVAGTLAPGASPGTLTFTVPVTMLAGSTLALDIDGTGTGNGAGNYSRVVVTGGNSFTAAGTIVPKLRNINFSAGETQGSNSFTPTLGQRFAAIVQADGGVLGGFSGLTQPDGLATATRFDAVYRSTAVDLVVTPAAYAALPSALGETGNQRSVGAAVDALRPPAGTLPSGDNKLVFDALYGLDGPGIQRGLDQIGGALHADTALAALSARRLFGDAIQARQTMSRADAGGAAMLAQSALSGFQLSGGSRSGVFGAGGMASTPGIGEATPASVAAGDETNGGERGWNAWTRAFGQFTGNHGDGNAAGFSASVGGGVAGIDRQFGDALRVGGAVGYAHGDLSASDGGGRSALDSYQIGIYGSYGRGPWFADAGLSYGYARYDLRRDIAFGGLARTATAKPDGHDAAASIAGGYRLSLGGVTVEPSAGLRYDRIHRAGFVESGAGSLNLGVSDQTLDALRTSLAATASAAVELGGMSLQPALRLGWEHELMDRTATASATLAGAGFTIDAAAPGRDAAVVGLSLAAVIDRNLALYAGYDGRVSANETSHAVTAGLKFTW